MTGLLAGALQLKARLWILGAVLLGVGSLSLWVALMMLLRRQAPRSEWRSLAVRILAIECAVVVVAMLQLYWVLRGIGIPASVSQAFALTVTGALASAAGFFPGGLGLRELLAAAFAPLIGLSPSAAFLGTATERIVGLVSLTALTLLMLLLPGRQHDPD